MELSEVERDIEIIAGYYSKGQPFLEYQELVNIGIVTFLEMKDKINDGNHGKRGYVIKRISGAMKDMINYYKYWSKSSRARKIVQIDQLSSKT